MSRQIDKTKLRGRWRIVEWVQRYGDGRRVYRLGRRLQGFIQYDEELMFASSKDLTEGDLRKIAAYFAAKPWPMRRASAKPPSPPKGIAQCPCHQQNFRGGLPAPRLAAMPVSLRH